MQICTSINGRNGKKKKTRKHPPVRFVCLFYACTWLLSVSGEKKEGTRYACMYSSSTMTHPYDSSPDKAECRFACVYSSSA